MKRLEALVDGVHHGEQQRGDGVTGIYRLLQVRHMLLERAHRHDAFYCGS